MDYRFLPDGTGNYIQYVLKDGDLLFTRYNGNIDLVGVCGQVRNVKNNFLYPDKLMRVRLNEDFCCKSYIEYLFQTSEIREYIVSKSKTSAGQNGLSGKDLKLTPITLPPLEEQVEIVRQVDQLFALADKLNAHYQKAKTHVDKLSQSVLAKAFRGELVPQDPNDEPAEKLLERIMEEKALLSQGPQRTRRNKK
jgi:type I restriction enzyme S subunit